jgi:group I intron endonuclease
MNVIIGIYKITNLINGKVYVGSAVNIKNRFKTHKRLLKNNKHFNNHLQSSYIKYGVDKFKYDIVETTSTEELLEKETYWIKLLNANNPEYGYNKRIIASSNLGIKLSDETKRKLRDSHLGHKRSSEANKKIIESQYKKICKFDREGNHIKTYDSLQDAARELNCKYTTSITACLKKRIPSALGYLWCYEYEKDLFIPNYNQKSSFNRVKIKITCLLTKKITIFESISSCRKSLNISTRAMDKGLKEKNYKNKLWERI